LRRLQSGDDPQSWQEFYRIYGGLIRFFAAKAGLTADKAKEVVQETAIGVARRMPDFTYDPKVCRFKTWLHRRAILSNPRARSDCTQAPAGTL